MSGILALGDDDALKMRMNKRRDERENSIKM